MDPMRVYNGQLLQMKPDLQKTIAALSSRVAEQTFISSYPSLGDSFPNDTFRAIILECTVLPKCVGTGCNALHQRLWSSNILALSTSFRVVMYDKSHLPLDLREVIVSNIMATLTEPLLNVCTIKFLGAGAFTGGQTQAAKVRRRDAVAAAKMMKCLFPNVTSLKYHLSPAWGKSVGFIKPPNRHCPLYEETYMAYADQLEHTQLHNPIPARISMFCDNLTSVSINVDCAFLDLLHIDDVIPWRLFQVIDDRISFDSLEELSLQFITKTSRNPVFPGCRISISFPKLKRHDIFHFFACKQTYNRYALQTVQELRVYKVEDVEHPDAMVGWFRYPLPLKVSWVFLRRLVFSASIADKQGLAHLIKQLPALRSLDVNCYSMFQEDASLTPFPDQKDTFKKRGQVLVDSSAAAISKTLEELFVWAENDMFDCHGFCELLVRLPTVKFAKVNERFVATGGVLVNVRVYPPQLPTFHSF
ncbi:hypothetical protein DL89DRAFT_266354 [Linderina pennispora]|uniref:F-box domain-containing protein n=1 Tax=Linderina pennispora TaxID=61395 RepID=A0A1Y1WD12_9FUNG|nr:uncharacterized protein DL89DRAFT_266354 [Linderina pennispora]ORX71342.1 hypothetical protein DL89DRAFT_266354 [Linderina pennispora]